MDFLRNLGKALKIGVTAYIAGGTAYWLTAEVYLRYIGKEITFSPLVSALLVVPFWPLNVYGDLRWIGVLPQDVAALLTFSASFFLLKYRLTHKTSFLWRGGHYRCSGGG